MLVPLYGFLRGDTVGLLVMVHDDDPVGLIATRLQQAAAVRVATAKSVRIVHQGRVLDPGAIIGRSGIDALDRVDVIAEAVEP